MGGFQRSVLQGSAMLSQLLNLQLIPPLRGLHLGLHILKLVEELQGQSPDLSHAVKARQLQHIDTGIPSLYHFGQPVIGVQLGTLFLQLEQPFPHSTHGLVVAFDGTSHVLESLTSLLSYSVHPVVDYLCSAHRGPNGQLGSPRYAVGTYKGKSIQSLRKKGLATHSEHRSKP